MMDRLRHLADLIDDTNHIPMMAALEVATIGGDQQKAQEAFRKFRATVEAAGKEAHSDFRLVVDSQKTSPRGRFCWFEGDELTDEALTVHSREAARLSEDPVQPEVTEVVPEVVRPTVHLQMAREASAAVRDLEARFVDAFTTRVEALNLYQITHETLLTWDRDDAIRLRLRGQADVVVVLTSDASWRERDPGPTARRPVIVALDHVPAEESQGVLHADRPFSLCTHRLARQGFVADVLWAVADRLAEPPSPSSGLPDQWPRTLSDRRGPEGKTVPPQVSEASSAAGESPPRRLSAPMLAVDRLVDWACDPSPAARTHCVLLGDVGTGKSTAVKMFTEELLAKREHDRSVPLPILFDLRELPSARDFAGANIHDILTALLEAVGGTLPTAGQLWDRLAEGGCVVIFDGLDEVGIHLTQQECRRFAHTLCRVTDDAWRSLPEKRRLRPPSKLVLTCRTHFFATIRDEAMMSPGSRRDGPGPLTLLMLPFTDEQVRAYLEANLENPDVDGLMDVIATIHNLRELAERPLTLWMLAQRLETIQRAARANHPVHPVDLYTSIVGDWLDRDSRKQELRPQHKPLLMEQLAAYLWRDGRKACEVSELENWFLRFFDSQPDLKLHYRRDHDPELWKNDLRAATFLIRMDDRDFQFAHTSMFEYFLASYLYRALELPPEQARVRWQLPVPSRETLEFLGQLLAKRDDEGRARGTAALATLAGAAPDGHADQATVLAFAYLLAASRQHYPSHSAASCALASADLAGWSIGGDGPLDLHEISLAGATLTGAVLQNVDLSSADLTGADLTRAELRGCDLSAADLRRAALAGAVLRRCDLTDARWDESTAHGTQALWCDAVAAPPRPGWLVAPLDGTPAAEARMTSFTGHSGTVTWAAWSSNSRHVVTAGADGRARIWDVVTGQPVRTLTGHTGTVRAAAWSPDGRRVVTAGADGTAWVWDVETGQPLVPPYRGHTSDVTACAWSPDGSSIATASFDETAQVWDPDSGECLRSLRHDELLTGVAWSPDGSHLLTASNECTVRLWTGTRGRRVPLDGRTGAVTSVAWSPDGTRFLTATADGTAAIWDVNGYLPDGGRPRRGARRTFTHTGLSRAAWSSDGQVVTVSENGSTRLWAADGTYQRTLAGPGVALAGVAWSPHRGAVVTVGDDGYAAVWAAGTGREVVVLGGSVGAVAAAEWSPDGRRIAVAAGETARVWEARTGRVMVTLAGAGAVLTGLAWSPDGAALVTRGDDGRARVWDAGSGLEVVAFGGSVGAVTAGAWSPDGRRIVVAAGEAARVWDSVTGLEVVALQGHAGVVTAAAWSPDGRSLVTTSQDRSCRIWRAADGQELRVLSGHQNWVTSAAWSPDGRSLVTTGDYDVARVWRADPAELVRELDHGNRSANGAAWSPDGRQVVITCADGPAQIWDVGSGTLVLTLEGPASGALGAGWSPDGRVLTTYADGTMRISDAASGQETDWRLESLPRGEIAVWSVPGGTLLGASDGAWRWLGWPTPAHDRLTRLPAETWGPLPSLRLNR